MDSNAKAVPMRGKVKDAEAEVLLKLLRQEKEYQNKVLMPANIQRKTPLPAIGRTNQTTRETYSQVEEQYAVKGSGYTKAEGGITTQSPRLLTEKEILNDSSFTWINKTDIGLNSVPSRSLPSSKNTANIPSYSWRTSDDKSYSNISERQSRRPSGSLPPLGYEDEELGSDLSAERPSCPRPSSPKLWED